MFGIRPCQSTILCLLSPQGGRGQRGLQCKDGTAWFEGKNFSRSTIYPPISVLGQSLTGRGSPHSSLSSGTGLCSQGHQEVGKGEESSWEMPEAGYLETIPGRKKEAARVGGSWRLSPKTWRKAKCRKPCSPSSNLGTGQSRILGGQLRELQHGEKTH